MKYLVFCFLIFSTSLFSQSSNTLTQKDYLILQDKVRSLINSNIDSAFILVHKIESSNKYNHKAFASGAMSYLFQLKDDSIKSKQHYKQAFLFLDKVLPSKEKRILKSNILNYGGLSDWRQNDLRKALDKFQRGLSISKEENDQIQIVKFNMNIALIYAEVGNFRLAIQSLKQSDRITDKIKHLFSEEKFTNYKSNINYYIGSCYEKAYGAKNSSVKFLDSAKHYFDKAILYSKNYTNTKVNSKMSLGNISYLKKDFFNAEKIYYDVLLFSQENGLRSEFFSASYNLANLFYELKKYDKSLLFFQKVDSIYKISKVNDLCYVNSYYYQAKIYSIYKDPVNALRCSKVYLDSFEKIGLQLEKEVLDVNFKLENVNVKKEMEYIKKENENKIFLKNFIIGFFILLFFTLILMYINSNKNKREANQKVNALIEEFKIKIDTVNKESNLHGLKENHRTEEDVKVTSTLNIDKAKEEEIFEKLKVLESKLLYLNSDFTQQWVAKKIKTNTSYLSYVVNKRFEKSFGEYSNELKINYVINELITNSKYRKYSTQAIAESVGFKNAVSFTKSFSKRTGVTPIQFTKRLDTLDSNTN